MSLMTSTLSPQIRDMEDALEELGEIVARVPKSVQDIDSRDLVLIGRKVRMIQLRADRISSRVRAEKERRRGNPGRAEQIEIESERRMRQPDV